MASAYLLFAIILSLYLSSAAKIRSLSSVSNLQVVSRITRNDALFAPMINNVGGCSQCDRPSLIVLACATWYLLKHNRPLPPFLSARAALTVHATLPLSIPPDLGSGIAQVQVSIGGSLYSALLHHVNDKLFCTFVDPKGVEIVSCCNNDAAGNGHVLEVLSHGALSRMLRFVDEAYGEDAGWCLLVALATMACSDAVPADTDGLVKVSFGRHVGYVGVQHGAAIRFVDASTKRTLCF